MNRSLFFPRLVLLSLVAAIVLAGCGSSASTPTSASTNSAQSASQAAAAAQKGAEEAHQKAIAEHAGQ